MFFWQLIEHNISINNIYNRPLIVFLFLKNEIVKHSIEKVSFSVESLLYKSQRLNIEKSLKISIPRRWMYPVKFS